MKKTTKKDFKEYRERVLYWLGRFEVGGWEVTFQHRFLAEGDRAPCYVEYCESDRSARFGLAPEWPDDIEKDLDRAAFHEVCELLFGWFEDTINRHGPPAIRDEVRSKIHSRIVRLEGVIFGRRGLQAKAD